MSQYKEQSNTMTCTTTTVYTVNHYKQSTVVFLKGIIDCRHTV